MAALGESLFAALTADAAVAALVEARVFPNKAPQDAAAPFVVYQLISEVPENILRGGSSLSSSRLQVDSYGVTYLEAHAVAAAVAAVFEAFSSPSLSAWRLSTRDLFDDEAQLHRVWADFSVWRPTS